MNENEKEQLRELSTKLMGLSMKMDAWLDAIKEAQQSVTMYRSILYNLIHQEEIKNAID